MSNILKQLFAKKNESNMKKQEKNTMRKKYIREAYNYAITKFLKSVIIIVVILLCIILFCGFSYMVLVLEKYQL